MLQYRVPTEWEKLADDDVTAMRMEVQGEATAADVQAFPDMLDGGGEKKPADNPQIKKRKADISTFLESSKEKVFQASSFELEAKEWLTKRQGLPDDAKKYSAPLAEDVDKHLRLMVKLSNVFKRSISEKPSEQQIPQLMRNYSQICASHASLREMAVKFDLATTAKKRRRA